MTDGLRIGPFSRASSLSIKALRAYHETGLFVPAVVDPTTGYRMYSTAQLLDAAVLRRLRDLDVPLAAVREVLEARDPVVTERVLAEHARAMQARLADTLLVIDALQRGLDSPGGHTPVHVRDESASHALVRAGRVAVDDFADFLGESFTLLSAAVERFGASVCGAPGGMYPSHIDDEREEEVLAFVPIVLPVDVAPDAPVHLGEVPAARVAVAVHLGGYATIGETYRRLGAWVGTNADPAAGPVRERYLVGPPAPVDHLQTEIQWPIVRPTTSTPAVPPTPPTPSRHTEDSP